LIRHTKNLGLDADFDQCVQEASGEYCWLFSDDDLMAPGAIERVLQVCRRKPHAIVVNISTYDATFSSLLSENRLPLDGRNSYSQEETELFFRDCAEHLSFIGCLIVARRFWLSRDRTCYYGTEFVHLGVLFQAPIPGEMVVLTAPLVKVRYGVGNWKRRAFEVWMYKWPDLIWSFNWINESIRMGITDRRPWTNAERLLSFRAQGFFGWREFKDLVVPRSSRVTELWKPLAFLVLPRWYVRGWASFRELFPPSLRWP
jgi:glycosyltransferase involved in cell wall biosynthesis